MNISDDGCGNTDECSFSFRLVPLDVKPRSCPNPLNVRSRGLLPVAILGTADFNIGDVDRTTLLLEGVAPKMMAFGDVATPFEGEPCDCHELGPDGYMDLTIKFRRQEIVAAIGPVGNRDFVPLTITGNFPVTYMEYLDYRQAASDVALLRGREDFWTDGGMWAWAIESNWAVSKIMLPPTAKRPSSPNAGSTATATRTPEFVSAIARMIPTGSAYQTRCGGSSSRG